ncbi:hypothetical protein K523DRAFT_299857 [Schizophyllum commune Tattone D]|nr:hypothetical protein K523DRAFT_299857 [Schizophyllum commune Tattone D]
MGPTSERYRSLLAEKDEEISRLQLLQKAHIARTAHAETRLLATLDILDATRAEAAQDAATLRSANAALSAKIGGVRAAAREIEAERDDLRHAVQKLIDRVEANHDYASWPCARMHSTAFVEPIKGKGVARTAEDDKLVDFASSQIASLRMQRDAERRAHASTRQRVIELEAAVARRDAELDACVAAHTHLHAKSSGPSGSSTSTKYSKMQAEPVVAFLDFNLITNRALEDELRALSRQVERRKRRRETGPPSTSSTPSSEHEVPSPTLIPLPPVKPEAHGRATKRETSSKTTLAEAQNMINSLALAIDALERERQQLVPSRKHTSSPIRTSRSGRGESAAVEVAHAPRSSSPVPSTSPIRRQRSTSRSAEADPRASSPSRSRPPSSHRTASSRSTSTARPRRSVERETRPPQAPAPALSEASQSTSRSGPFQSSDPPQTRPQPPRTPSPSKANRATVRESDPASMDSSQRAGAAASAEPSNSSLEVNASSRPRGLSLADSFTKPPPPASPEKAPPEYDNATRYPDLTADLIGLREELDGVRNELAAARGKLGPALREISDLRDDLDQARRDLERARKEQQRAREERESDRAEMENLRGEARDSRTQAAEAQNELGGLRDELARLQRELERVNGENTRLSAELARASSSTGQASEEARRLTAELEQLRNSLERVTEEVHHLSSENHRLTAENERLRDVLGRDRADEAVLALSEGEGSGRPSIASRSRSGSGSSMSLSSGPPGSASRMSSTRVSGAGPSSRGRTPPAERDATLGSRGFRTPSPLATYQSESSTGRTGRPRLPMRRPSSLAGRSVSSGSRRSSIKDRPPTPGRPLSAPSPGTSPAAPASAARPPSSVGAVHGTPSFAFGAMSFAPSHMPSTAYPTPSFAHVMASTPPRTHSRPNSLSSPINLHPLHPRTPVHSSVAASSRPPSTRSRDPIPSHHLPPEASTAMSNMPSQSHLTGPSLPEPSYSLPEPPTLPDASTAAGASTVAGVSTVAGAQNLLDVDDGEMSMELATPLLPTTMFVSDLELPTMEGGGGSRAAVDSLQSMEPLQLPPPLRPGQGTR